MGPRVHRRRLSPISSLILIFWASGLLGEPVSVSVVPNMRANTEGNFDNRIPWSDQAPVRYQQVYLGSEVGDIEIDQILYRLDGTFGKPLGGTLSGVVVVLSSTSRMPDDLSMSFSENLGADATVVYSGDLYLYSTPSGATPRQFNAVVPLSQPFVFDASTGPNLLLDVTIAVGPDLSSFDADSTMGDSVSRVFCWLDEECLTADTAMLADSVGLVTMLLDAVFVDGFESGDTSGWSVVRP